MMIKVLNGSTFRSMLINGLNSIMKDEKRINDLNVFPVPDGDTGSNMRLTLENGIKKTTDTKSIGELTKLLSRGMLLGARGNSGVILSQLFKGLSVVLADYTEVNAKVYAKGLVQAYKTAYEAVINPTEGTLLTVAREAILNIIDDINDDTTINDLFVKYYNQMKISLADTPNKLKVLKDAGVVDSGGTGLLSIYEGMIKYLDGDIIDTVNIIPEEPTNVSFVDGDIEYGYCTEFILMINQSKNKFNKASMVSFLETQGDSLVVIEDEGVVKVHIHTMNPGLVIGYAQEYGEFANIKIENMQIQHNEVVANNNAQNEKKIAYVAVAQGDGIISLFDDFGVDIVINGGQTMNTSTEEFIEAFNSLNAENIIVMPNNKNIYLAAKQAVEVLNCKNIHVLDTKSIAEGYFALSMSDTSDEKITIKQQIDNMNKGISNVNTLSICSAVRDTIISGVSIKEGDYISLLDNEFKYRCNDPNEAVINSLSSITDIDDKEIILVFKGQLVSDEKCEELIEELEDKYPNAQVGMIEGNQDVYDYVLGIS